MTRLSVFLHLPFWVTVMVSGLVAFASDQTTGQAAAREVSLQSVDLGSHRNSSSRASLWGKVGGILKTSVSHFFNSPILTNFLELSSGTPQGIVAVILQHKTRSILPRINPVEIDKRIGNFQTNKAVKETGSYTRREVAKGSALGGQYDTRGLAQYLTYDNVPVESSKVHTSSSLNKGKVVTTLTQKHSTKWQNMTVVGRSSSESRQTQRNSPQVETVAKDVKVSRAKRQADKTGEDKNGVGGQTTPPGFIGRPENTDPPPPPPEWGKKNEVPQCIACYQDAFSEVLDSPPFINYDALKNALTHMRDNSQRYFTDLDSRVMACVKAGLAATFSRRKRSAGFSDLMFALDQEAGLPSQTSQAGLPSQTPQAGLPSQTPQAGLPSQTSHRFRSEHFDVFTHGLNDHGRDQDELSSESLVDNDMGEDSPDKFTAKYSGIEYEATPSEETKYSKELRGPTENTGYQRHRASVQEKETKYAKVLRNSAEVIVEQSHQRDRSPVQEDGYATEVKRVAGYSEDQEQEDETEHTTQTDHHKRVHSAVKPTSSRPQKDRTLPVRPSRSVLHVGRFPSMTQHHLSLYENPLLSSPLIGTKFLKMPRPYNLHSVIATGTGLNKSKPKTPSSRTGDKERSHLRGYYRKNNDIKYVMPAPFALWTLPIQRRKSLRANDAIRLPQKNKLRQISSSTIRRSRWKDPRKSRPLPSLAKSKGKNTFKNPTESHVIKTKLKSTLRNRQSSVDARANVKNRIKHRLLSMAAKQRLQHVGAYRPAYGITKQKVKSMLKTNAVPALTRLKVKNVSRNRQVLTAGKAQVTNVFKTRHAPALTRSKGRNMFYNQKVSAVTGQKGKNSFKINRVPVFTGPKSKNVLENHQVPASATPKGKHSFKPRLLPNAASHVKNSAKSRHLSTVHLPKGKSMFKNPPLVDSVKMKQRHTSRTSPLRAAKMRNRNGSRKQSVLVKAKEHQEDNLGRRPPHIFISPQVKDIFSSRFVPPPMRYQETGRLPDHHASFLAMPKTKQAFSAVTYQYPPARQSVQASSDSRLVPSLSLGEDEILNAGKLRQHASLKPRDKFLQSTLLNPSGKFHQNTRLKSSGKFRQSESLKPSDNFFQKSSLKLEAHTDFGHRQAKIATGPKQRQISKGLLGHTAAMTKARKTLQDRRAKTSARQKTKERQQGSPKVHAASLRPTSKERDGIALLKDLHRRLMKSQLQSVSVHKNRHRRAAKDIEVWKIIANKNSEHILRNLRTKVEHQTKPWDVFAILDVCAGKRKLKPLKPSKPTTLPPTSQPKPTPKPVKTPKTTASTTPKTTASTTPKTTASTTPKTTASTTPKTETTTPTTVTTSTTEKATSTTDKTTSTTATTTRRSSTIETTSPTAMPDSTTATTKVKTVNMKTTPSSTTRHTSTKLTTVTTAATDTTDTTFSSKAKEELDGTTANNGVVEIKTVWTKSSTIPTTTESELAGGESRANTGDGNGGLDLQINIYILLGDCFFVFIAHNLLL